jgi:cation transport regulator
MSEIMPYSSIDELPPGIRNVLPAHAQHIFLAAYNNSFEEYQDPAKRRGSAGAEEVARKVAWAAVKKEFEKDPETGMWEPLFTHH